MLVYDCEENFHILIAHHLLVYLNTHTNLRDRDWLMGYFYEILVL